MTIVIRNRMIQKNPNPRITYTIGGQINWQSQPIPWLLYLIEETPIYKYIKRCLIVCSGWERERERGGDLESWSLAVDFFSTPRTMVSVPRTPTAALPLRTASRAYSTWNKWPSGEKTVIALSYLAILRLRLLLLQLNSTDLISSLSLFVSENNS